MLASSDSTKIGPIWNRSILRHPPLLIFRSRGRHPHSLNSEEAAIAFFTSELQIPALVYGEGFQYFSNPVEKFVLFLAFTWWELPSNVSEPNVNKGRFLCRRLFDKVSSGACCVL